jgi:hypothetical protein
MTRKDGDSSHLPDWPEERQWGVVGVVLRGSFLTMERVAAFLI